MSNGAKNWRRQKQKRNAGVSPLRCAPVEMTVSVGGAEENRQLQQQVQMRFDSQLSAISGQLRQRRWGEGVRSLTIACLPNEQRPLAWDPGGGLRMGDRRFGVG